MPGSWKDLSRSLKNASASDIILSLISNSFSPEHLFETCEQVVGVEGSNLENTESGETIGHGYLCNKNVEICKYLCSYFCQNIY